MVVISDTTTITNLIQVDLLYTLPQLYKKILIPGAVYDELARFEDHKQFLDLSEWIEVVEVTDSDELKRLMSVLDRGEAEAIILSLELDADYLIIDEMKGRKLAKQYRIPIIGLLGILILSKKQGIITQVKTPLEKLRSEIGFRISEELFHHVLNEVDEE